jgi:hypothetical protein
MLTPDFASQECGPDWEWHNPLTFNSWFHAKVPWRINSPLGRMDFPFQHRLRTGSVVPDACRALNDN